VTDDDPVGDSTVPTLARRIFAHDAAKVATLFLSLWVVFYLLGVQLGYDVNGVYAQPRRVFLLAGVYSLAVLALNIQWGYAGLFNIGVAGFMAVGAYTFAMVSAPTGGTPPGLGLPVPVGIVAGVLAAALIGLVASLPALRLKADYLAIVTLAFSEIIRRTYNSPAVSKYTGGASGFDNLPTNPVRRLLLSDPGNVQSEPTAIGKPIIGAGESIGLIRLTTINYVYTAFVLVLVLLVYLLLERAGRSPFGRVLKAIREDETAAESLGKDTQLFKIKAFALGCALMGLAGIVWYAMGPRPTVTPTVFRPILTFFIFIALIIGGAGSNTGSVVGGAIFAGVLFEGPPILTDLLRQTFTVSDPPNNLVEALTPLVSGNLAPLGGFLLNNVETLRFIFVGVLLILLIQRRPQGLLGGRQETAAVVDLNERSDAETGAEVPFAGGNGGTAADSGGEDDV
jgi:branched-chain amino acid transport system permease protein